LLVDEVLRGVASRGGRVLTKLLLSDLSIRACQSCGPNASSRYCRIDDDMGLVFAALERSRIVVLGSPVYFDSVSAQTKLMIDRCNCLCALMETEGGGSAFEKRLREPQVGVFVAVGGGGQDFSPIHATAAGFFSWIGAELVASLLYAHERNERGGVRSDARWIERAFEAGVLAASRCAELSGT